MEQTPTNHRGASTLAPVGKSHLQESSRTKSYWCSSCEGVDTTKIELASKILDCDGELIAVSGAIHRISNPKGSFRAHSKYAIS